MISTDIPTGYGEIAAVLERLPILVREARRARRLALRPAAEQIGTTATTVMRLERGEAPSAKILLNILRWLDQPID